MSSLGEYPATPSLTGGVCPSSHRRVGHKWCAYAHILRDCRHGLQVMPCTTWAEGRSGRPPPDLFVDDRPGPTQAIAP
eukprot:CAMPEP_0174288616 /NCGR_PEP_ID=MMETSP0809-20121228/21561_1 /TAXON_ID=73025 ORGANISM="Eutreptiella gymnastica-like, Strain CCMP1594" /NCGR_SAMPLE_ID=MMETSP0809 /ASSEMBLY_ACC=CAM_ASM_000658 /LENGTH=77 /DNA_ID=CAMNT_0015385969 /DNA_START=204 /DNA_END=437 /DNA_ORIENTATION=-